LERGKRATVFVKKREKGTGLIVGLQRAVQELYLQKSTEDAIELAADQIPYTLV